MGDLLPGVALRFHPGLLEFAPSGLKSRKKVGPSTSSGPGNLYGTLAFALKGQNMIAQGNALGKWTNKTPSPERAKGFGR